MDALIAVLDHSSEALWAEENLSAKEAEEVKDLIAELYSVRAYQHQTIPEFVSAVAETLREVESFPANEIPPFKERLTKLLTAPSVISIPRAESRKMLEARFTELAQRWRNEVRTISSTTDRVLHSAYQDIIGMGKPVLPLIFREMAKNGGHWFWALRHITQENPVAAQDAGNVQKMTQAWLQWGREHHYI